MHKIINLIIQFQTNHAITENLKTGNYGKEIVTNFLMQRQPRRHGIKLRLNVKNCHSTRVDLLAFSVKKNLIF